MRSFTLAAVIAVIAACAGAPPTAPGDPEPLAGAAAERVRAQIAAFDGPDGPSQLHGSPGTVTTSGGETLPYDRYLLVGSQLSADRGRSFDTFVEALRVDGAEFQTIEVRQDGKPAKIMVVLDGKRIVVSVQQW